MFLALVRKCTWPWSSPNSQNSPCAQGQETKIWLGSFCAITAFATGFLGLPPRRNHGIMLFQGVREAAPSVPRIWESATT